VLPPPPIAAVQPPAPAQCREFKQAITVGGKTQQGVGTQCLQPDGTWRVVGAAPAQTPPTAPSVAPPPIVAAAPPYPVYPYPYPYPYPYAYAPSYPAYYYGGPGLYGGVFYGRRWR
jgi:hypothetical protein